METVNLSLSSEGPTACIHPWTDESSPDLSALFLEDLFLCYLPNPANI
jgi:hypothetical protein